MCLDRKQCYSIVYLLMLYCCTQFEDRQDQLSNQSEKLEREKSKILVEVGGLQQEAEVEYPNFIY